MKTFLKARWEEIVMVNYAIDASVLQPYLPYGVELDTYDGSGFVSSCRLQIRQVADIRC